MSKTRAAIRRALTETQDTLARVGVTTPVVRRMSLAGTIRLANECFTSAARAMTDRVRP